MPKIKFSALVSGMSGKANGSVFATNNGGSYFRTNASKIKPKTASNSVRKSLFTGVSQAWRSLTSEQQTAWNNAVDAFVVQNAFGDNRTPTGYEVFTRLNNTRATYSLPILVNPPTPRDLPAVGEMELVFPDLFQFFPNFALTNFNQNNATQQNYFYNEALLASGPALVEGVLSGQFYFGNLIQVQGWLQADKGLFEVPCTGGNTFRIDVRGSNDYMQNVALSVAGGSGSWNVITTDEPIDVREPFTVAFVISDSDVNDFRIFVNGIECTCTKTPSGTFAVPTASGGLRVGNSTSSLQSRMFISDVRWTLGTLTTDQLEQLTLGYVLGIETYTFPFNSFSVAAGTPNTTENLIDPFFIQTGLEAHRVLKSFSSNRVPQMSLTTTGTGLDGVNLNVYATAPMSFGKTGKITNFRLIASLPWNGESEFEVWSYWKEKFKSFSPNGYVNFYVTVFDTTTGVIPATQIKPPKRKPFKAGSEMGTAVS